MALSSDAVEVVIGATRKELRVTLVDENGAPLDLTGGAVKLQGKSADLPSVTIDHAGVIHDAVNGVARFAGIGDPAEYVALADLGGLSEATFSLRVKFTDADTLVDYSPVQTVVWKRGPLD